MVYILLNLMLKFYHAVLFIQLGLYHPDLTGY